MGERISCEVVAAALQQADVPARALDARSVLITDGSFGRAQPLLEETGARVRESVRPLAEADTIPVLGGFIGSTRAGVATTLGRGGSHLSPSLFTSPPPAAEIQ